MGVLIISADYSFLLFLVDQRGKFQSLSQSTLSSWPYDLSG